MARLNPAVMRALDVLELLMRSADPLTLRVLTETLGLPRTTAFELLTTLGARGYVVKSDGEPARFSLGVRAFQLGSAFADRLDYVDLGRAASRALTEQCDETSHVAVLDGVDVVYIARTESRQKVRMVSHLGSRLPAHATAVGKALLAQLSTAELRDRFPADVPLPRLTLKTITTLPDLEREMELIRARGYAIEECESNDAVCCAAAAVRDHVGRVVAAISVSVPENRWSALSHDHWISLVTGSAAEYSKNLGFASAINNLA